MLSAGRVVAALKTTDKLRLLAQCAGLLAQGEGTPSKADIETALIAREQVGSTGLGNGVALPHGRIPGVFAPIAAFLQLDPPIDFGAADGQQVDLVLAFIVPEHFTDQHLRLLAHIAELLSDPLVLTELRGASDSQQLNQYLRGQSLARSLNS